MSVDEQHYILEAGVHHLSVGERIAFPYIHNGAITVPEYVVDITDYNRSSREVVDTSSYEASPLAKYGFPHLDMKQSAPCHTTNKL